MISVADEPNGHWLGTRCNVVSLPLSSHFLVGSVRIALPVVCVWTVFAWGAVFSTFVILAFVWTACVRLAEMLSAFEDCV